MSLDNRCDLDESNLNKNLTRNKNLGKKTGVLAYLLDYCTEGYLSVYICSFY